MNLIKCELATFDDIKLYSQRARKIEFACVLLLCNRLFIGKQLYVVRFSYQRWEKGVKLQGFRREKKKEKKKRKGKGTNFFHFKHKNRIFLMINDDWLWYWH